MARPKVLPRGTVSVRFKLPADFDAGMNALAIATGESKSTHLRRAVAWYLAEYYGLDDSDVIAKQPTTARRRT